MEILSAGTKQTIRDSFELFVLCLCLLVFAIVLAWIEKLAMRYDEPAHVILLIEYLVTISVVADALVFTAIVARLVLRAYRDLKNENSKK